VSSRPDATGVRAELEHRGARMLATTFVDNGGITRVKTVPLHRLEAVERAGVGMSMLWAISAVDDHFAFVPPYDGPSGDIRLVPDVQAARALAAAPGWAWAPADQRDEELEPFPACQRSALRRVVAEAERRGLSFLVAFETELSVVAAGAPAHDGPGYGARALAALEPFALELVDALEAQGIEVEQFHPEYSPGQVEVSVAPRAPLAAADEVVLLRLTAVQVARRHGLEVSFAPLVFAGGVGNGCHLHLSAWREGRNLMRGGAEGTFGAEGASLVAGVLGLLPEMLAVLVPGVSGYQRLQPGHWAGAYACWGVENREAALRYIPGSASTRERSANLEVKVADAAANPYLATAAVLGAALRGLAERAALPPPVREDPHVLGEEERRARGIERLPQTLGEATAALAARDPGRRDAPRLLRRPQPRVGDLRRLGPRPPGRGAPLPLLMPNVRDMLAGRGAAPHRSLWLREALGDAPDALPLEGAARADVCIVGGGYVGLWTAYWLKRLEPGCDVVLLEQDVCGGGASGRNGGFMLSWWAKLPSLVRLFGPERALDLCRRSQASIDQIEAVFAEAGIDAHIVRGGWLWTARTPAQLGAWETAVAACERYAPGTFRRLDPQEVARRAGSPSHLAGVLEPGGATVQPALLARGLRRLVLELGVRVHEHTRVRRFSRDERPVRVEAEGGSVDAGTLVLATNAWAAGVRELHRRLVVISSDIVATPPIPERLAQAGWTGGECITDSQLMIDYYRTTRDGRIAFGKGGWGVALAGRIPPSFDRSTRRAREVARDLYHAYPQLRDVPVAAHWSGPIDRSADGLPLLGYLGGRRTILYGVGWSGNGVAPSQLGGRVLASRALRRDDEHAANPLWDRRAGALPPEPLRYAGAHVVRGAVRRKELAEAAGRRPHRVDVALAGLVPAGLEDH
jgi:glutamine synthetase/glycine/D-amino acid oxidase-like deaminating enzyme